MERLNNVLRYADFVNESKKVGRSTKRLGRLYENEVPDELKQKGIIELKDGLTLDLIKSTYPWLITKTVIENAVVGKNDNGLVWYSGNWKRGVWKGGTFAGGTFGGTSVWLGGTWGDKAQWKGAYYLDHKGRTAALKSGANPSTDLKKEGKGFTIIAKGEGVVNNKFRDNAKQAAQNNTAQTTN